jgi:hypothetical protein
LQNANAHQYEVLRNERATARKQRQADKKHSRSLEDYAGRYESDLNGDVIVRHSKDGLTLQFGPRHEVPLTHWAAETFYAKLPVEHEPYMDWLCTFNVRKNGEVDSFDVRRLGWRDEKLTPFLRSR